jgi:CheY-like chemotaxis protein/HPt (histidine-containing phosphotransfer) domain-containing protein
MNASASLLPRILLLEDDPVSAAFLTAAIEGVPAVVDVAATLAEARNSANTHTHAVWLFDANLPDGLGADLLAELRAGGLPTPALAHTADARRESLDALIDAGFEEVLLKPLSVAQLQGAVRRFCGDAVIDANAEQQHRTSLHCDKQPIWDDDAALRALNGNRAHVDTMRALFAQELPPVRTRVSTALANRDVAALRGELHKLQASCGFVGAARLGAATRDLQDSPDVSQVVAQFEGALQDTLTSLSACGAAAAPSVGARGIDAISSQDFNPRPPR